ncbi:MAG: thiamine phosphate synthase [Halanaerobacter sp.]
MSRDDLLATDLYGITAEEYSRGRSNVEVVEEMVSAGLEIIQYRAKNKEMRTKYKEAKEIRKITEEAGVKLIINDDIALAISIEADGVHVGQKDLPVPEVCKLVGPEMIIGLSTHSPQQAQEAVEVGVDYIGVGPIFATQTKEDVCSPVGLDYLDYVVENIELPFVAIGGIKEDNIIQVSKRGANCIAMVTEIVEAEDIKAKVNSLRDRID